MRVVATQPRSILFPYTTLFRSFGPDPVLDAEVTEHLDGALVGDVRARRVGGAGGLGDGDDIDAVGCQERRGGKPGRPGPYDEDVGVDGAHDGFLRSDVVHAGACPTVPRARCGRCAT